MAIEEQRLRVRRSLEEKLGMEEASYLMDRPVGGWSELVTNHTLDLKLDVIEARFRGVDERFDALEHRIDASIAALRHELLAEMARGFGDVEKRFGDVEKRFGDVEQRFGDVEQRFGDLAWKIVTAVIAGMAVMATIFAGVTAGLVLLLGP